MTAAFRIPVRPKKARLFTVLAATAMVAATVLIWGFRPAERPPLDVVSVHLPIPPPPPHHGRAVHVILVSIDGLRPDAIPAAEATTLLGLIKSGASCANAETITPSVTLPSHTSMLTGLDFGRHGVTWNVYRPGSIEHPTVFSLASAAGLSTAMLFSKDKFHFLAKPGSVHWLYGPPPPAEIPVWEDVTKVFASGIYRRGSEEEARGPGGRPLSGGPETFRGTAAFGLAAEFAKEWPGRRYDFTFIHFRELDAAGHSNGWMSAEYIQALEIVDQALARILETVRGCGEWTGTTVIVTADHGGSGRGHFSPDQPRKLEDVRIPWICIGPGVPAGLSIKRLIRTVDTTPTVLAFFGLTAPPGLDGTLVQEVLPER